MSELNVFFDRSKCFFGGRWVGPATGGYLEIESPSAPIYQEGPAIALSELCEGMRDGELCDEWLVWSEPPLSYADYVFRGASKAAKLDEPPVGSHDL